MKKLRTSVQLPLKEFRLLTAANRILLRGDKEKWEQTSLNLAGMAVVEVASAIVRTGQLPHPLAVDLRHETKDETDLRLLSILPGHAASAKFVPRRFHYPHLFLERDGEPALRRPAQEPTVKVHYHLDDYGREMLDLAEAMLDHEIRMPNTRKRIILQSIPAVCAAIIDRGNMPLPMACELRHETAYENARRMSVESYRPLPPRKEMAVQFTRAAFRAGKLHLYAEMRKAINFELSPEVPDEMRLASAALTCQLELALADLQGDGVPAQSPKWAQPQMVKALAEVLEVKPYCAAAALGWLQAAKARPGDMRLYDKPIATVTANHTTQADIWTNPALV